MTFNVIFVCCLYKFCFWFLSQVFTFTSVYLSVIWVHILHTIHHFPSTHTQQFILWDGPPHDATWVSKFILAFPTTCDCSLSDSVHNCSYLFYRTILPYHREAPLDLVINAVAHFALRSRVAPMCKWSHLGTRLGSNLREISTPRVARARFSYISAVRAVGIRRSADTRVCRSVSLDRRKSPQHWMPHSTMSCVNVYWIYPI